MKDKSACVVDIKPKTMVWTFWLKNPNDMELDTNPKIQEREPLTIGIEAKQYRYRDYIGMNDKNQLQLKYSISINCSNILILFGDYIHQKVFAMEILGQPIGKKNQNQQF